MNEVVEKMVEIPIEAEVLGRDGLLGRSTCVVLDPTTDTVTDFVLQTKGLLRTEYLVPRRLIRPGRSDAIHVDLSKDGLRHLKPFYRTNYLEVDIPHREVVGGPFVVWPFVVPEHRLVPVSLETIPVNELAIHRRAKVQATDGPAGRVDEFMLDLESGHVTHLVMREGHLWGKRDVMIPVAAIASMDEELVRLSISKAQISDLPVIAVKERSWEKRDKHG